MNFAAYRYLFRSDLYRYRGSSGPKAFLIEILLNPGFQYTFWMRTCAYTHQKWLLKYLLFPIARLVLRHYTFKYGIDIPYNMKIGPGFYIGHFGGIFVNADAVIGKNCNIHHGVSIATVNRGKRAGCPTIGDNVYIGPGAKVIGNVKVGDNVAIGANCVVTKDVPDHAVVVGVPGQVISDEGSVGYINKTDYECA